VSPVSGVKPILQKTDPTAAKSDLIFPSKQFTAKCDAAPPLSGAEETIGDRRVQRRGQRLELSQAAAGG
jgi:hypothetical protein